MTVLLVERWIVRPECQAEHAELWRSFREHIRRNPDLFKEIRSMRFYDQTFGTPSGAFVQVVEFDSLADKENLDKRLANDEESSRFHKELMKLKDPATVSACLWEPTG